MILFNNEELVFNSKCENSDSLFIKEYFLFSFILSK